MSPQELQVQQKREVDKKQELTAPARTFVPATDIFETDGALTIVMEMPGTDKNDLDISVEDGVLHVEGRLTSISIKACSRSTPSTSSATTGAASRFPTRSIRIKSVLR